MSRPLRIIYPGAFYHVTSRGNEKRKRVRGSLCNWRFVVKDSGAGFAFGELLGYPTRHAHFRA